MLWAKMSGGAPQFAPNPIRLGGRDIITTDPSPYGYKRLVEPEPPEAEGMRAVPDGWDETETEIIRRWRLEAASEEATEEDYEAALARLGVI